MSFINYWNDKIDAIEHEYKQRGSITAGQLWHLENTACMRNAPIPELIRLARERNYAEMIALELAK